MPAVIECEKVSPLMQKALQSHIVKEREKRKQEAAEAEKDFERKAKEEEEKRKKIEEENSTLEEIKEQLAKLKEKQETLRKEKHQLFWQFKQVLHEEESKRKKQREQNELNAQQQGGQFHGIPINSHHMFNQGSRYKPHFMNQPGTSSLPHGVKRPHSPTPPSSGMIQMYGRPTLHPSPQHKYDPSFAGHAPYLSPSHNAHLSHSPSVGQISNRSHPYLNTTPDRSGNSNSFAVKNPDPIYIDEPARGRIRMLPQIPINHQSGVPYSNQHMRSNSPGRYSMKSDRDSVSYSPARSGSPGHHKYMSPQSNSRLMYSKHP